MHANAGWAQVRAFSAVAAIVVFAVAPASADQVEDELKQMRELVLQLKDQVDSQQAALDEQGTVIRDAGLEDRSSSSRLSSFLETTDFSGSIAASYFYNFNNPAANVNANNVVGNPFHPDHNSIQLDEAWFSMSRAASSESPVGFGVDLAYGQLGDSQGFDSNGDVGLGGNGLWLQQAYLSYMPLDSLTITAGKFGTHIGYEVPGAANNVNITRPFTYNLLQPFSQIGAKASMEIGGFIMMAGVANSVLENQPDDTNTDFIWQVGWSNDTITALFNGEWGKVPAAGDNTLLILNSVVEIAPTDAFVAWLDITWADVEADAAPTGTITSGDALGISVGSRLGLGDRAGVGARFDWGTFDPWFNIDAGAGNETDLFTITGTFDYLLAEGLTAKAEVQWTKADANGSGLNSEIFPQGKSGTGESDFLMVGVQLVYAF